MVRGFGATRAAATESAILVRSTTATRARLIACTVALGAEHPRAHHSMVSLVNSCEDEMEQPDAAAAAQLKRLILCFDGTWNTPEDATNVSRMYAAVGDQHGGCPAQLKYY